MNEDNDFRMEVTASKVGSQVSSGKGNSLLSSNELKVSFGSELTKVNKFISLNPTSGF